MKKLLLCVCLFLSLVSFLSAGGKVETRTVDNPESWDEARVIDEINSAWENRKDLKGRDNNMWQGISKSGVVMRGYKSPRITAYPVFEGDR